MSYQYGGGYPNQPQQGYGGGYPPQQSGYSSFPQQQATGMPQPTDGTPYAPQPIGFGSGAPQQQGMPMPSYGAQPPAGPGYPPAQPGYPSQAAPPSGYPPQQAGYPAQQAYPPAGGYPGQPGQAQPAAGGYHAPAQAPPGAGYPGQQPSYAGAPPAQPAHSGAAPQQHGGYGTGAGYGAPAAGGPQNAAYGQAPGRPAPPTGGYYTGQPSQLPPTAAMQQLSVKQKETGTVTPTPGFNAEKDAEILRKAMKGLGTDEKAIIDVLGRRTAAERQQIKTIFKTMYGKDLLKELKGELSGHFEDVTLALMETSSNYDAMELRRAMKGAGTDEQALIEIMCTRTNAQIREITAAYKTLFKRNLEKDLISETSGHFKRLLVSMSTAGRMEDMAVDTTRAAADARALYEAGEKQWGTDESKFNQILAAQSYPQLRLVFDEYGKISRKSIEQAIDSEFSGDIKNGLLAVVMCVKNRPYFFATQLHRSMKGAGTDDRSLIRLVVTRSEVDMVQIKAEFQQKYKQTLDQFIKDDCSGDYKRMLLALVGAR